MNLEFGPETAAFRERVRAFIRANLPAATRRKVALERMDLPAEEQKRWHRLLYEQGGWGCPGWPAKHGGPGWSDEQQYVFERELALNDAPRLMLFGVGMLGPTLMEFGTEDQKARFLPAILRGEIVWCQGFSEPNAGSDLAALQCRAERDGGAYLVNGSKMWTTDAHIADWMFGLFRTDSSGKKQHGITMLLVDMRSPGITIRPILTFDGTHEINQVFFDGVRVPLENRVGAEHQGWAIAKYMLGLERFGTAEVSRSIASLARLKRLAARARAGAHALIDDPAFRDRIAEAEVELRALELTEQRFLFGRKAGALGPEASILKIRGTEVQQRILELTMEALGYYAHVKAPVELDGSNVEPVGPPEAAYASQAYFNYRKTSIYSGSNEIQKNIIAKAVLGL